METINVGTWVVHGLKIQQVKEIDDDFATVSDGYFETSGRPVKSNIRTATLRNKRIADDCSFYYNKLNTQYSGVIRNWPDLHGRFTTMCLSMIDASEEERLRQLYKELEAFYNEIVMECENLNNVCVRGIYLFHQK